MRKIIGIITAWTWFLGYVGGGAYLLAKYAVAHLQTTPPWLAFFVFGWIFGFFAGHQAIEYTLSKLFKGHEQT